MKPLDEVETMQAMRDVAGMAWVFFEALKEQGFSHADAMQLTATWLAATLQGGKGQEDVEEL